MYLEDLKTICDEIYYQIFRFLGAFWVPCSVTNVFFFISKPEIFQGFEMRQEETSIINTLIPRIAFTLYRIMQAYQRDEQSQISLD